ncbi:hypothetical protein DICVIV_07676 [Dictyocaulus viviparus]|uniref:Uncharacterized protein n=1 Tax=Dictyocaulus viviparus TaxID=29172 RepID=A0A0D8XNT1_DICVI|nr:hypothetical protein DICVIV_07676 [Dictyocaulus viviparus]
MDDLLSVALSEAGLEEFLTPTPLSSDSLSTSETSTTPNDSANSDAVVHKSTNDCEELYEDITCLESYPMDATTSTADVADFTTSKPSTASQLVHTPSVGVVRKLANVKNVVYRQINSPYRPSQEPGRQMSLLFCRPVYTANPARPTQLFKQIVQTPDGPRTQLLRPFINGLGQTVYRPVRAVPSGKAVGIRNKSFGIRDIHGTSEVGELDQQSSSNQSQKRPQRVVVIRQNTPSGQILVRKPIPAGMPLPHALNRTTNGGVVRRFISRGGIYRNQSGFTNTVSQRALPSSPTQTTYRNHYLKPNAAVSSNSSNSQSVLNADGGKPTDAARMVPCVSRQTCCDCTEVSFQIKSFGTAPKPYSKSQKAKDEMRRAHQSATEKRSEIDEDEENLGYAETYSDYIPAKLRSGIAHPDSVVETASLSSVSPPDVKYQISIPEYLIDCGSVSALQLEAVIYACQMHQQRLPTGERTGYLIGDGAGVGKGRTVAAIIFENYLLGRKRSIWLSVSADLKFDAERDLRDIGAGNIKVYALNKLKYAKISGKENGNIKKGVIFATYSSLIGECRGARAKYRSRLKQLIQWFGVDYDGVIILDECHRAKNLVPTTGAKPTKTGRMVLELQKALPNARVVYASATGATEPRNMAYMTRLGLWGLGQAFPEFVDFINAVERRGVGAMEIVAMDMKQRGLYLARQLSFRGVSFIIQEVSLSEEFIKVYDDSVKLWLECRRQFQVNTFLEVTNNKTVEFILVDACVQMARDAIRANKCVVIGLQSTGEARTLETLEEMGGELTEFVSTAKAVLQGLIERHFPSDISSVDLYADFDVIDDCTHRTKYQNHGCYSMNQSDSNFHSWRDSPDSCSEPHAKKSRYDEDQNSTTSSSGDDDYGDLDQDSGVEEEANVSDTESSHDNSDDWLKALLAEAASSSDTDDDDAGSENQGNSIEQGASAGEDEFNPFNCDFTADDPWASKQQVVEDSPKKQNPVKLSEEEEELRLRRRARRKRRKKRMKKLAREAELKRKREIRSDAMAELLSAVERLGPSLPPNTLDHLIDQLGGPEYVAEMTGRKGRIVTRDDGEVEYELRHAGADVPLELMNMDEKDKFMKGEKKIAIISEAASSGISLQYGFVVIVDFISRRIVIIFIHYSLIVEHKTRVGVSILHWSCHGLLIKLYNSLVGLYWSYFKYFVKLLWFASIVAKRLESLGALTHGDRRATESRDLSQFNLDTRYGRDALEVLLKSVIGALNPPLIPPPANYIPGNFFQDMRLYLEGVGLLSKQLNSDSYVIEREAATIAKFLNRILGIPVHAQNALFQYFTEIVAELIAQAKLDGTYDMGIMGKMILKYFVNIFCLDLGSFQTWALVGTKFVSWKHAYLSEELKRADFVLKCRKLVLKEDYLGMKLFPSTKSTIPMRLYAVTRPSIGRSPKLITMSEISKRFVKVLPADAKKLWEDQYAGAVDSCHHTYVHGKCKSEAMGVYCEVGRRTRTYFVLSGSVLSVWPVVEEVLSDRDRRASRMQVIRVRTEQDQKIVDFWNSDEEEKTLKSLSKWIVE